MVFCRNVDPLYESNNATGVQNLLWGHNKAFYLFLIAPAAGVIASTGSQGKHTAVSVLTSRQPHVFTGIHHPSMRFAPFHPLTLRRILQYSRARRMASCAS